MKCVTQHEEIARTTATGLSIDELADISGVSIRSIRYYQTEGLLPPPTLQGRCAIYTGAHLNALERIKDAKATRGLAELYAERPASIRRPSPVAHAQRGDRVEPILRCVIAGGVEVLISVERTGLSREAIQTMISEVATVVQRRVQGESAGESPLEAASLEPASPEATLRLLGELKSLGLTDDQFRRLHPKPGETINSHLTYVRKREAFRPASVNVLVNHRLQLCSTFLRARARQTPAETTQQVMDRCVDDAVRAIPIP